MYFYAYESAVVISLLVMHWLVSLVGALRYCMKYNVFADLHSHVVIADHMAGFYLHWKTSVLIQELPTIMGCRLCQKYKEGHIYKCEATFINVRLHLYM